MNISIKTKIIGWFCVFSLVGAVPLNADENSNPMTVNHPPNFEILDKWRGSWKVTAIRRQPDPKTITYDEHFDWVMNGRFLRGETSQKSDGTKAMSMLWYDVSTKSYRFILFDSSEPGKPEQVAAGLPLPAWSGVAVELPPPTWDEKTQTMAWDTGLFGPVKYTGRTTFSNKDTIQWNAVLKDWKGTVVLDVEGTSIRQNNP